MTIRKGELWGGPTGLPRDGVVAHSDAEARAIVEHARRDGAPIPPIGLLGGDLCKTMGGRGDANRLFDGSAMALPCDVVAVELDDSPTRWFVAHLAARRGWWRGRALVAMNAAWLGPWNLGPKAHPNDGLVDVTEARVPLGQRRAVLRRLPTGAHLPHPALAYRRVRSGAWELDRPTPVRLDGDLVGVARHIRLTVEPDAFTAVV
ncbi:MAG TPA: hypothetical protein VGH94_05895 [Acidimicrobiales bacterium]|jgi:hypothetical protein